MQEVMFNIQLKTPFSLVGMSECGVSVPVSEDHELVCMRDRDGDRDAGSRAGH